MNVNAALTPIFMLILIRILLFGLRTISQTCDPAKPTTKERPFQLLPAKAFQEVRDTTPC